MEKIIRVYINFANQTSEKLGIAVSWLTTVMVIVVCVNVGFRYILGWSYLALQDLSWHLFGIIFLLGAPYTLLHDRHVRVDVFYINLSPKMKAWVNLLGGIVFLIPFCILGMWVSWDFVAKSYAMDERSPDPGGLPARYLLKGVIPLGFFFLLMQGLSLVFTSFLQITGKMELPESEGQ
jgi:TRAP-type mannitol/chloroaromatic compound transport system permease small subunit